MAIFLGTLDSDRINGTESADLITALSGDDRIVAGGGADIVDAGSGNDMIYANNTSDWRDGDVDTILAGSGDDHVFAAYGDILSGGIGLDSLSLDLSGATEGVTANFRGSGIEIGEGPLIQIGNANVGGFEIVSRIIGSDFDDEIQTRNRDRAEAWLDGGAGNDKLGGGAGEDRLEGGTGDDRLIGGNRSDMLTGGAGADRFVFEDGDSSQNRRSADTVTDFSRAEGDRFVLRGMDAVAGGEDDAFTFIGSDAFTGTAGELRAREIDGDTLLAGDTDGDGSADFYIVVSDVTGLAASDFAL